MNTQPHASPKEPRAFDRRLLGVLACCAVGYGLNSVWCILIGHTPAFMASIAASGVSANPRLFYLAGIAAFAAACVAWPGRLRQADRALRLALPLAGLAGTVLLVLPANGLLLPFVPWGLLGLFATGIVFLWIAARYVLVLALAWDVRAVIGCVTGGIVVKVALVQVVSGTLATKIPLGYAVAALLGACVLFEVACVLLRKAAARSPEPLEGLPARTVFGVPRRPARHRCAGRNERTP